MTSTRTFRIARPLARLAATHATGSNRVEGHFPRKADRTSHVVVEGPKAAMVVVADAGEERVEIPRSHADALLDVATGQLVADRHRLPVPGPVAHLDRYTKPSLDLVHVAFDTPEQARAYVPAGWLGEEVGDRAEYAPWSLALEGLPKADEPAVTGEALDAFIDAVEEGERRKPTDSRVEEVVEGLSRMLTPQQVTATGKEPHPVRRVSAA